MENIENGPSPPSSLKLSLPSYIWDVGVPSLPKIFLREPPNFANLHNSRWIFAFIARDCENYSSQILPQGRR